MKSFSKGKESPNRVMVHWDSSAAPARHLPLKSVIRYHFYLAFPFSGLFHTFTFVKVYWLCFLFCKSVENLMNQKQQWNKGNFLFIRTGLMFPLWMRAPGLLWVRWWGLSGEEGEGALLQPEAGPPQACGLTGDQHGLSPTLLSLLNCKRFCGMAVPGQPTAPTVQTLSSSIVPQWAGWDRNGGVSVLPNLTSHSSA